MVQWPFEYPGEMDETQLETVALPSCTSNGTIDDFAAAVEACGAEFEGQPGQLVPLFSIRNSQVERVHRAQEAGWQRVLEARKGDGSLFEND